MVKELSCHTAFQPCTSPYAVPLLRIFVFLINTSHIDLNSLSLCIHIIIIFFYSGEILDLLKPCQFLPLNDLINHDPLLHNFSTLQLNIYFYDQCICVHMPFLHCKPHEDWSSIVVINVYNQWSALESHWVGGTMEIEMIRWCHWISGHEFEQTPGDSEGQGSLVCCSPWGCRVGHSLNDWTTAFLYTIWKLTATSACVSDGHILRSGTTDAGQGKRYQKLSPWLIAKYDHGM